MSSAWEKLLSETQSLTILQSVLVGKDHGRAETRFGDRIGKFVQAHLRHVDQLVALDKSKPDKEALQL